MRRTGATGNIPTVRRTLTLGCTIPTAVVIMTGLIFGSGILPIPMWLLLSMAGTSAVVLTVPAILFGRRLAGFFVLAGGAVIGTLVITFMIFGHFQETGFRLANEYARALATAATETRAATGTWPTAFEDLPDSAKPKLVLPRPYLAFCKDGVCGKVAGYFIEYNAESDTPRAPTMCCHRNVLAPEC